MSSMPTIGSEDAGTVADSLGLSPSEEIAYHAFIAEQTSLSNGLLYIGDVDFSPGDILRKLSPNSYRDGYPEFLRARQEGVLEGVSTNFPTAIAYWCHMFTKAFDSELQRWLFLKDTWEATIRLLHALIVAEVRAANLMLTPSARSRFDHKNLLSDSMDQLLNNVEEIVRQGQDKGWNLATFDLLGEGSPNQLRTLNRLRNTFAHNQTPNDLQAKEWTEKSLEVLIHVFMQMDRVRDMKLVRFKRFDDINYLKLRCEPFFGSSTNPDRIELDVTESVLTNARSKIPPYLTPANILVYWRNEFLCLSPFFHFRETSNRHGSQLSMFKRTRQLEDGNRVLEYEVLGESEHQVVPRGEFDPHLASLKVMFEEV